MATFNEWRAAIERKYADIPTELIGNNLPSISERLPPIGTLLVIGWFPHLSQYVHLWNFSAVL